LTQICLTFTQVTARKRCLPRPNLNWITAPGIEANRIIKAAG